MRLHFILFVMSIGMLGVLVATHFIDEQPASVVTNEDGIATVIAQGHGVANEGHATMLSGGNGAERYQNIWPLALVFGLLQIGFFLASLAAGGQKHGKLGPLRLPLIIGGTAYAAVFIAMVLTHRTYAGGTARPLFLGWPIPTAWMMYGVWLVPLVFMFAYLLTFDGWVYTEEDKRKLEQLLAEQGPERPES